jgi:hypothetical protein
VNDDLRCLADLGLSGNFGGVHEKAIRKLHAALETADMVLVVRAPRYGDRLEGFVVGMGRKWAVLARTMEGGYFDGYVAFRLADVLKVSRDQTFAPEFSRLRPEWPAVLDVRFDLDTTAGVLQSFSLHSPLIAIEKERERSAMWIGEFRGVERKRVWLHEVRPRATWRKRPLAYKLGAITSVSIETHYLTALAAIAGRAPLAGSSPDVTVNGMSTAPR